jgi:hypothetical protein
MRHQKMTPGRIVSLVGLIFLVALLSFTGCRKSALAPQRDLVRVPPPEKFPEEGGSVPVIDDVKLNITPYFWQDFMPTIPPGGPPFLLCFEIQIKNRTGKSLRGLTAGMTTLYYSYTQEVFHTFQLIPGAESEAEETLLLQEEKTLAYANVRKSTFSPQIEQGTKFYGRILVKWNGKIYLLSSPPASLVYTY